MSIAMSAEEIEDFLSGGNIARIATVKPDNSPHVTPVWYLWENNQLLITIPKDSVKARNIRQNNKVAITIDTDKAPSKAVIIEGTARIEDLSNEITRKIDRRMAAKYVKPEYLDEYIEWDNAQGVEYIYLRIRAEKNHLMGRLKDSCCAQVLPCLRARGFRGRKLACLQSI